MVRVQPDISLILISCVSAFSSLIQRSWNSQICIPRFFCSSIKQKANILGLLLSNFLFMHQIVLTLGRSSLLIPSYSLHISNAIVSLMLLHWFVICGIFSLQLQRTPQRHGRQSSFVKLKIFFQIILIHFLYYFYYYHCQIKS